MVLVLRRRMEIVKGKIKLVRRYRKSSMAKVSKDVGARVEIWVQVHEINQRAV